MKTSRGFLLISIYCLVTSFYLFVVYERTHSIIYSLSELGESNLFLGPVKQANFDIYCAAIVGILTGALNGTAILLILSWCLNATIEDKMKTRTLYLAIFSLTVFYLTTTAGVAYYLETNIVNFVNMAYLSIYAFTIGSSSALYASNVLRSRDRFEAKGAENSDGAMKYYAKSIELEHFAYVSLFQLVSTVIALALTGLAASAIIQMFIAASQAQSILSKALYASMFALIVTNVIVVTIGVSLGIPYQLLMRMRILRSQLMDIK